MRRNTDVDFWRKVDKKDCWEWQGGISVKGYGTFSFLGRQHLAHRIAWFLTHGYFPKWPRSLDHLCRNRKCVRPDHLEDVDIKENVLRGVGQPALNARKTHCKYGHPLAGNNIIVRHDGRACRLCHYENCRTARRASRRARREKTPVKCDWCSTTFVGMKMGMRFCSLECKIKYHNNQAAKERAARNKTKIVPKDMFRVR